MRLPVRSTSTTLVLLACLVARLMVSPLARGAGLATKQACVAASEQGQQLRSGGMLVDARDAFIRCASDLCPKLVRVDCAEQLTEVDRELPTIAFNFVTADGQDLAGVGMTIDATAVSVRTVEARPGQAFFRVHRRGTSSRDAGCRAGAGHQGSSRARRDRRAQIETARTARPATGDAGSAAASTSATAPTWSLDHGRRGHRAARSSRDARGARRNGFS